MTPTPRRIAQRATSSCMAVVVPVLVAALLLTAGVVAGTRFGWWALTPFSRTTVDRTGPSVLKSLTDLQDYHAASGHFETIVDLQDDVQNLPSWIAGERVLYVGKGDVDAVVSFTGLAADAVDVSADRTTATIRLPHPTVGKPVLDIEHSYVVEHDQGIVDRFQGSDLEHRAQLRAVEQMSKAAREEGRLVQMAEQNTTTMLKGLLGALGFTTVTVAYR